MNLRSIVKTTQGKAIQNSPALLTGVGVAGVITTAYLTGKASFRAAEILREDEEDRKQAAVLGASRKEQFKMLWTLYIPAVAAGTFTCGAVVMANRIGTRRLATMAAAFAVTERAYDEYKEKVVEQIGEAKEKKVRTEIRKDRMTSDSSDGKTIYVAGDGGDHLVYEQYMGHYTRSSMEGLNSLRNEMNERLLHADYVSLSDWYNALGIPSTPATDALGWRSDGGLIELEIDTTMSDKGVPCLAFDFRPAPRPGYDLAH